MFRFVLCSFYSAVCFFSFHFPLCSICSFYVLFLLFGLYSFSDYVHSVSYYSFFDVVTITVELYRGGWGAFSDAATPAASI